MCFQAVISAGSAHAQAEADMLDIVARTRQLEYDDCPECGSPLKAGSCSNQARHS
jgi:hypothetical protein